MRQLLSTLCYENGPRAPPEVSALHQTDQGVVPGRLLFGLKFELLPVTVTKKRKFRPIFVQMDMKEPRTLSAYSRTRHNLEDRF